jgi:RHS repeat-associated protein
LGNVQVVVSDRKVPIPEATNTTISYFTADIVSATDYYAFGAVMPDRSFNAAGYRFGFNGKENDNEVKGTGNQQDYGMRIYDGRIGRFLSVDALTKKFSMLTPYQFASNTPIQAIDLDGLEASTSQTMIRPGLTEIKITLDVTIVTHGNQCAEAALKANTKYLESILSQKKPESGEYVVFKLNVKGYTDENTGNAPFVIEIADLPKGLATRELGNTKDIGNTQNNVIQVDLNQVLELNPSVEADGRSQLAGWAFALTIAHEIGHAFGLRHPEDQHDGDQQSNLKVAESPQNLMRTDTQTSGTEVLPKQFDKMKEAVQSQEKEKKNEKKN